MSVVAVAHPNIAFIKYWGKVMDDPNKINWALNPSFSMTLDRAQTQTRIRLSDHFEFCLNGNPASEADTKKLLNYLAMLEKELKVEPLERALSIDSKNNFPTAAGIASSASAFAALCLAYLGLRWGEENATAWCKQNLAEFSRLCRLGSGSACRSVAGGYMYWEGSHAVTWQCKLKLFDTVLILSSEKKKVSSRDGHLTASQSPLLAERLQNLPARSRSMMESLKLAENAHGTPQADIAFSEFGRLLEEEALEMHSLTQKAPQPVEYWSDETRKILTALREKSDRNYFFTIDAGPNLHLISMQPVASEVRSLCKEVGVSAEIWEDSTGGPPRFIPDVEI